MSSAFYGLIGGVIVVKLLSNPGWSVFFFAPKGWLQTNSKPTTNQSS